MKSIFTIFFRIAASSGVFIVELGNSPFHQYPCWAKWRSHRRQRRQRRNNARFPRCGKYGGQAGRSGNPRVRARAYQQVDDRTFRTTDADEVAHKHGIKQWRATHAACAKFFIVGPPSLFTSAPASKSAEIQAIRTFTLSFRSSLSRLLTSQ